MMHSKNDSLLSFKVSIECNVKCVVRNGVINSLMIHTYYAFINFRPPFVQCVSDCVDSDVKLWGPGSKEGAVDVPHPTYCSVK